MNVFLSLEFYPMLTGEKRTSGLGPGPVTGGPSAQHRPFAQAFHTIVSKALQQVLTKFGSPRLPVNDKTERVKLQVSSGSLCEARDRQTRDMIIIMNSIQKETCSPKTKHNSEVNTGAVSKFSQFTQELKQK